MEIVFFMLRLLEYNVMCNVVACPPGYTYVDHANVCFTITATPLSQSDAQLACQAEGAHLARIDNELKKVAIQAQLIGKVYRRKNVSVCLYITCYDLNWDCSSHKLYSPKICS
jgi:hypothetical protein